MIEAGTGSGGSQQILSLMVGKEGHIYSYERREEMTNWRGKISRKLARRKT
jgi:tRNA A58 N-methylase Trm61